jgi:hypothetical protein
MSSINVYIYSYKSKALKDVVDNLIANKSGKHSISITISDQNPIDRSATFRKDSGVDFYQHIFWDWIYGPAVYKARVIHNNMSDYMLIISDDVMLSKDWDSNLVDFVGDKDIVVSGNYRPELEIDKLFFIKKIKHFENEYVKTNMIDRNLLFANKKIVWKLRYPEYLKYHGEEESLSIGLFCMGFDIYSAPESLYRDMNVRTIENTYAPFSLLHNYNLAVDLITTGKNRYTDTKLIGDRKIQEFYDFFDFDFKKLKRLPFIKDDVLYDPESLAMNKISAERYVATTKAIR